MIATLRQVLSRRGRKRLFHPVSWGSLRTLQPCSQVFGFDRGTPIDRSYIENFLNAHRSDVQGHVLEIGDDQYTRQFGDGDVHTSDVLHATEGNDQATLVGDLATGRGVPCDRYDAFVLTQTLQMVYDVRAAVQHAWRALKPGGVLLATLPGISRISRYDMDRWGDYWRFTSRSAETLFADVFGISHVSVSTYGNVLAATAFLQGIAAEELETQELLHHDPDFEILVAVRAVRDA